MRKMFLAASLLLCPGLCMAQAGGIEKLFAFSSSQQELFYWASGPRVFGLYNDGTNRIVVSDGTRQGTREMAFPGKEGRAAVVIAADDSVAFFAVSEGGSFPYASYTLWRMNADDILPSMVTDRIFGPLLDSHYSRFRPRAVVHQGRLYWGTESALWCSNGTEDGTRALVVFDPAHTSASPHWGAMTYAFPSALFPLGDRVLFNAYDGEAGLSLWATDGTPEGTGMIADLCTCEDILGLPCPSASDDFHAVVGNGWSAGSVAKLSITLCFGGYDLNSLGDYGEKELLIRRNGSGFDILPGENAPRLGASRVGGSLYGLDVRSDALQCSRVDLATLETDSIPVAPSVSIFTGNAHTALRGRVFTRVFFNEETDQHGLCAWDPLDAALTLIKAFDPMAGTFYPANDPVLSFPFATSGGWLYFPWEDSANGAALWRTDGTPEGTELAADFNDSTAGGFLQSSGSIFAHRQRLYFVQTDNNASSPPEEKGRAALFVIDHQAGGTAPQAVIYGMSSRVWEGSTVTLRAGGDGLLGHLSYEWFFNGQSLGVYTDTLTLTDVTAFNTGAYTVRIYDDSKGVNESAPFVLEVLAEGALPLGAGAGLAVFLAAVGALILRQRTKTAGRDHMRAVLK